MTSKPTKPIHIMRLKHPLLLTLALAAAANALAQTIVEDDRTVHFRTANASLEGFTEENHREVADILHFISFVDSVDSLNLKNISFYGNVSLEGSHEANQKLALKRRQALEKAVLGQAAIADSLVVRDDSYINWKKLAQWVAQSPDFPKKDEVLAVLAEPQAFVPYHSGLTVDARIPKLKKIDGGRAWKALEAFFPEMRVAGVMVTAEKLNVPVTLPMEPPVYVMPVPEPQPAEPEEEEVAVVEVLPEPEPQPAPAPYEPRLTLKTNAIGWGLAMANLGVEVDICPHLSFNLPVYYSAVNYFKSTIKFRTLELMPEFRVWPSRRNDGFFVGAHFGLAWYNFAFDGDYRYQDHDGNTPALGGGIALGYRLPLSRNGKWKVEFTAGAGCYKLHYDKFMNTPDVNDGRLVGSEKKTYIGLDQLSVAFSYSFSLKKGGAR